MDKGIRPESNKKFAELLQTRENTRIGNTKFRAAVIGHLMESFDCTLASAATHYNHSFIEARKQSLLPGNEALATLLAGLGRPEDKKGGRKPKPKAEAAAPEEVIEATPTLFLVKKAKGGEQVGEPMSQEAAKALCEAAAKAKKAKLFWIAA